MPGTTPTDWLDPLTFGTTTGGSAGAAETTSTLGTDRLDTRVPPDAYHLGALQISQMKNLLITLSAYLKGGTRVRVLQQSSNPFGSTEVGYYSDNATVPNPRFSALGTLTYLANGAVTAKGDLCVFNGTNFAVLAVGSNDKVLTADSTAATGVKWATAASSGTVTSIVIGTGLASTQSPLTTTGTMSIDQSFTPTWTGAHTFQNNITQTGATTFGTGTGTVSLNGATVFAANQGVTVTAGTSAFDFSGGTGLFKTSTGAVTIGNGAISVTGAVTLGANIGIATTAGTGAFDLSNATGIFKTSTGAVTIGDGSVSITGGVTFAANIGIVTSPGTGLFDFSNATGVFKTSTGAITLGNAAIALAANTVFTGASSATNTTGIAYVSTVTDGATTIAHKFNNTGALTTTAKLASFQNNAAEKAYISQAGFLTWSGTSTAIPPASQWTAMTGSYTNSWADYGAGATGGSYMKDANGFVHLRGLIKDGTMAASFFTLPAGYRPAATINSCQYDNGGVGLLNINSDGTCVPNGSSNAAYSILCSFLAEG